MIGEDEDQIMGVEEEEAAAPSSCTRWVHKHGFCSRISALERQPQSGKPVHRETDQSQRRGGLHSSAWCRS